jgi:hypothetical protein
MKSCTQVWKTRNLTFKGKTLIVKNFLLAQMGFETEIRGIPEKYKKEVNDLIWKFLWDNKPNQIERNICCLNSNEGGMGYFCNQCLPIAFHESISLLIILYIKFICLLLTKLSMLIIPIPPSLIFKQHTFLSI